MKETRDQHRLGQPADASHPQALPRAYGRPPVRTHGLFWESTANVLSLKSSYDPAWQEVMKRHVAVRGKKASGKAQSNALAVNSQNISFVRPEVRRKAWGGAAGETRQRNDLLLWFSASHLPHP